MSAAPARGVVSTSGRVLGGRWVLGKQIGAGGVGTVHEATHATLGRRVAVKLLDPDKLGGPTRAARFVREAQVAAAIEHEHVVAVVDHGVDDGQAPFLVMERLEGEDAAHLLAREGPLAVARAVDLIVQASRGVAAAHERRVLHRDLKPSNLFVARRADGGDRVKLLDFGIAQILDDDEATLTGSGDVLGSPHYMAPEQAAGRVDLDERVDVYGLGAVLYELLTGRRPHPGPTRQAALAHALTRDPEPLAALRPDAPAALIDACARALSRDREARFTSAVAFAEAITASAGPPSREAVATAVVPRRRIGRISVFAGGALVAAAALRTPVPHSTARAAERAAPEPTSTSPAASPPGPSGNVPFAPAAAAVDSVRPSSTVSSFPGAPVRAPVPRASTASRPGRAYASPSASTPQPTGRPDLGLDREY